MEDVIRHVLEQVDDDYTLDLTRRLIQIPSIAPPLQLVEIADVVSRELASYGLSPIVEGDSGDGWSRPNVLAVVGEGSPVLLLAAHTDVVPPGDLTQWRHPPFAAVVEDGLLYGRGAADTKASLGAMMAALRAIVRSKVSLAGKVVFAAWAGDEWRPLEARWFNGLAYLAEAGRVRADAGIFGEPYDLHICCTSRGRVWLYIEVGGESTHSATGKGINAILNAVKVIDAVYRIEVREHPVLGRDTINVGTIEGGVQPNIVPDRCRLTFDIRFSPPRSTRDIEREVHAALEALRTDPTFLLREVTVTERREPIAFPDSGPLVAALRKAGSIVGRELALGGALSFGDIADWKDLVGLREACLFGPGKTSQAHAINEHVAVADLVAAARIYAAAVVAYCGVA
ncbi:MAG: ArgE/DapE family deacylase [Armatimonadota bacterium]|nr:ArgE/DapE family deacylase [Armatimonadota bacterium]